MKTTNIVWAILLSDFRVATIAVNEDELSVLALFSTKKKAAEVMKRLGKKKEGLRLAKIELLPVGLV